ncbi:MAG TPA: delta-60 repeat domain-containing protein [Rudaea sp.]|nr:delta-60 repeat domain-containing protein [Rudaea sp.]
MRRPSAAIVASVFAALAAWSVATLAECPLPSTPNDGYFDQTWTGKGCITFNTDNRNAAANGTLEKIAVTTNGNLLIGGDTSTGSGSWWIGELTAQGAFDTTFGDSDASGRITECQLFLPGTCPSDIPEYDFVTQPDGKVLVLSDHYLARTNVGGHAFDTAGVTGSLGYITPQFQVATPYGVMYGTSGGGLSLTSGGKIFVGGYSNDSIAAYLLGGVARVNVDLSLDTTFHATTENMITYAGGTFVDTGDYTRDRQVLIQSTGRIVLIGTKYGQDFRVSRLNADGSPDPSFGTNGTAILSSVPSPCSVSYWSYIPPRPALIDRADRILLTGQCYANGTNRTVVTRLTADGVPDTTSFGTNGYYVNAAFAACPNTFVEPRALAIDSAGRILVGGTCDGEFGVERLRGDGTLDTTFGISGLAHGRFDPTSVGDEVDSIVFDRSGHPVIGGRAELAGLEQAGVARLTYDLIFVQDFEIMPRGCLPPECN